MPWCHYYLTRVLPAWYQDCIAIPSESSKFGETETCHLGAHRVVVMLQLFSVLLLLGKARPALLPLDCDMPLQEEGRTRESKNAIESSSILSVFFVPRWAYVVSVYTVSPRPIKLWSQSLVLVLNVSVRKWEPSPSYPDILFCLFEF